MAPSAPERRPQPHGSGRLHPVDQIFVVVLRRDRATLVVDHVVAIEAGGDLPLQRRVWQKVSSQLLDREFIEGQVAVVGRNHPVPPVPHLAHAVDVVAVRVGITGQIKPLHRHPLAVVRRLQEAIHHFFVSGRRAVGQESIDVCGGRRQPRQVERHPANQRYLVGLRGRLQISALEARQNEIIDRIFRPTPVLDLGQRRAPRRNVGPVRLPFCTLVNPAADELNLPWGETPSRPDGRHANRRVLRADLLVEFASGAVPGNDHLLAAAAVGKCAFLRVQAQA